MKFRLLAAHYWPEDKYLEGEKEAGDAATIVGDGTQYPIYALSKAPKGTMTPTLQMEPLDDEAREALEEEQERLDRTAASIDPIEQLARTVEVVQHMDGYERRNTPGFEGARK
jgi:hypothetical protein